jgi:hypothetical protein
MYRILLVLSPVVATAFRSCGPGCDSVAAHTGGRARRREHGWASTVRIRKAGPAVLQLRLDSGAPGAGLHGDWSPRMLAIAKLGESAIPAIAGRLAKIAGDPARRAGQEYHALIESRRSDLACRDSDARQRFVVESRGARADRSNGASNRNLRSAFAGLLCLAIVHYFNTLSPDSDPDFGIKLTSHRSSEKSLIRLAQTRERGFETRSSVNPPRRYRPPQTILLQRRLDR